jgi:hypothetical protein
VGHRIIGAQASLALAALGIGWALAADAGPLTACARKFYFRWNKARRTLFA